MQGSPALSQTESGRQADWGWEGCKVPAQVYTGSPVAPVVLEELAQNWAVTKNAEGPIVGTMGPHLSGGEFSGVVTVLWLPVCQAQQ